MDKDIRILTNLILKNHYRIVGITGISGSGKSTLAYWLKERLIQQNKKVI
ncbi:MAG: adenylyl-sulfate kinase, partial [Leptonema sp. (in: bacteria)]